MIGHARWGWVNMFSKWISFENAKKRYRLLPSQLKSAIAKGDVQHRVVITWRGSEKTMLLKEDVHVLHDQILSGSRGDLSGAIGNFLSSSASAAAGAAAGTVAGMALMKRNVESADQVPGTDPKRGEELTDDRPHVDIFKAISFRMRRLIIAVGFRNIQRAVEERIRRFDQSLPDEPYVRHGLYGLGSHPRRRNHRKLLRTLAKQPPFNTCLSDERHRARAEDEIRNLTEVELEGNEHWFERATREYEVVLILEYDLDFPGNELAEDQTSAQGNDQS